MNEMLADLGVRSLGMQLELAQIRGGDVWEAGPVSGTSGGPAAR